MMTKRNPSEKGQYGDFVRTARTTMKMTQERFAAEFGKTKGNVSSWETNRHNPSLAQMQRMSLLSGVPLPGAAEPTASYGIDDGGDDDDAIKRLVVAFGWLTDEQQKAALTDLEAKAETNKAISRELGPRWEFISDKDVGHHIKPASLKPLGQKQGRRTHGIGDKIDKDPT